MTCLGTILLLMNGCSAPPNDELLSDEELSVVHSVIRSYSEKWIEMDSTGVLDLFTNDAVISPSGLRPREGKQQLREFWFPNDGSVTEISSYEIEVLDAGGSGGLAYTREKGSLSFTYTLHDLVIDRSSTAYATTLYRRSTDGSWKIFSRMWTDTRLDH